MLSRNAYRTSGEPIPRNERALAEACSGIHHVESGGRATKSIGLRVATATTAAVLGGSYWRLCGLGGSHGVDAIGANRIRLGYAASPPIAHRLSGLAISPVTAQP